MAREMVRKCAAEVVGTFALVFAGTGAVVGDAGFGGQIGHVGVALTWGLVVMALIYAVGDVSGAHLNSAVTMGFWLSKRFPGRMVGPYLVSQAAGAFLASGVLRGMFGNLANLGATLPAGGWGQSFVLEVLLTGGLMFVALCVSSGPKEVGVMAGIAGGAWWGWRRCLRGR